MRHPRYQEKKRGPIGPGGMCFAKSPPGSYRAVYCSRERGHPGDHVGYWGHDEEIKHMGPQPAGVWL